VARGRGGPGGGEKKLRVHGVEAEPGFELLESFGCAARPDEVRTESQAKRGSVRTLNRSAKGEYNGVFLHRQALHHRSGARRRERRL
jgi:hypothetical protein